MPCYHPIDAWRSKEGKNEAGKWPLVFKKEEGNPLFPIVIPCGRCIGCRLERSKQWAIRCVHESSMYEDNSFLTLTYDNKNLIERCGIYDEQNGKTEQYSLNKRDFVLFIKRLRKYAKSYFNKKLRYFHCGEYGTDFGRPHHHACIFGFDFPDKQRWPSKKNTRLYVSETLNKLWGYGYCIIGEVNYDSAAYVARYVTKKITGEKAVGYYDGREPEYITFSQGIGKSWYKMYETDVRSYDSVVMRGGLTLRPPKYYDRLYEIDNHDKLEEVKRKRKADAIKRKVSQERLLVKEKIKRILLKQNLQRIYENG